MLLVDPDPETRLALIRALEAAGYAPVPCADAASALAALASGSVVAALVDALIAGTGTGDLIERARQTGTLHGVPVVLTTRASDGAQLVRTVDRLTVSS